MDVELPEETENMIDRFLNYAPYPTLPTTTAASLLPPLIFKYPSKLQTLVEKLPGWFLTKWSTKGQTLQQEKGCNAIPTFKTLP